MTTPTPPAADPAVEAAFKIRDSQPAPQAPVNVIKAADIIRRHYAPLVAENAALKAQVEKFSEPMALHSHCLRHMTSEQIAHLFGEKHTTNMNELNATITDLRAQLADAHSTVYNVARVLHGEPPHEVNGHTELAKQVKQQLATAQAELAQERARLDWQPASVAATWSEGSVVVVRHNPRQHEVTQWFRPDWMTERHFKDAQFLLLVAAARKQEDRK